MLFVDLGDVRESHDRCHDRDSPGRGIEGAGRISWTSRMNDLNKLAVARRPAMSWDATERPPRWYLWEGGFLLIGRGGGEVPAHSHHAIQVTIAFEGGFAIRGQGGEWRKARGVIVRPDVEHAFDALGETGAMLFVDPESAEGAWLLSALAEDITLVPEARVEA
ncbi:MAG TPA: hypothetical protein VFJ62_21230, partial [Usitatibacter sp.]|nr:hypothetical protein [Usitatibacter sp.]